MEKANSEAVPEPTQEDLAKVIIKKKKSEVKEYLSTKDENAMNKKLQSWLKK